MNTLFQKQFIRLGFILTAEKNRENKTGIAWPLPCLDLHLLGVTCCRLVPAGQKPFSANSKHESLKKKATDFFQL